VDLEGGYYDAGDNVKFGLPMAFTVTMMSWSVLEYGEQMAAAGELGHAMEAVKWGTDYFVTAHPEPNVLYGEVQIPCLPLFFCLYELFLDGCAIESLHSAPCGVCWRKKEKNSRLALNEMADLLPFISKKNKERKKLSSKSIWW
jgi:hypothetical protein